MQKPEIKGPDCHDFHDSSLIDFLISPHLDSVSVVLSTPDEHSIESLWLVECKGVVRLEYETVGDGISHNARVPLEIYDVYIDHSSDEQQRWKERLKLLGDGTAGKPRRIFHVVLASSFIRGWGKNEYLEGINIICRSVSVRRAPPKYNNFKYSRPKITADE